MGLMIVLVQTRPGALQYLPLGGTNALSGVDVSELKGSHCVGLAAGIGYLGAAIIMSIFFCFANLVLWMSDYGRNPVDDMKRQKRRDKLQPARTD